MIARLPPKKQTSWFGSMSHLKSSSVRKNIYMFLPVQPIAFSNRGAAWLLYDMPFSHPMRDFGTSQHCLQLKHEPVAWQTSSDFWFCLTYKPIEWRTGKPVNDLYIQSILYNFRVSTPNLCWIYSQRCLHISVSVGGPWVYSRHGPCTKAFSIAPPGFFKKCQAYQPLSAWLPRWLQQDVCSQVAQKFAGRRTATREATALGSSKVSNLGAFESAALPGAHVWDMDSSGQVMREMKQLDIKIELSIIDEIHRKQKTNTYTICGQVWYAYALSYYMLLKRSKR